MKISVLKTLFLAVAFCGIAVLSSCAGSRHTNASADGVYGPDGKPVSFNNGVPVSTSSNQFSAPRASSGGGGGH